MRSGSGIFFTVNKIKQVTKKIIVVPISTRHCLPNIKAAPPIAPAAAAVMPAQYDMSGDSIYAAVKYNSNIAGEMVGRLSKWE